MMPRSVIQSKMKLAYMSGEEIVNHFTRLSKTIPNSTPLELAKSAERRHGYKDRPYYSQHFSESNKRGRELYRKLMGEIEKRNQDKTWH